MQLAIFILTVVSLFSFLTRKGNRVNQFKLKFISKFKQKTQNKQLLNHIDTFLVKERVYTVVLTSICAQSYMIEGRKFWFFSTIMMNHFNIIDKAIVPM